MEKRILMLLVAAGIMLLSACKNSGHYEVMNNADTAQLAVTDSITRADKFVKTSEMRFKVKDVQQSGEKITALTNQYKGIVMHHEVSTTPERSNDVRLSNDSIMRVTAQSITAQMIIKVPTDRLESFMNEIGKMGLYVNLRKMNIEDKTFDYLSANLKLQSRSQIIKQQNSGKVIIKDPAAVMQLKDDMIDQKVGNMIVDNEVKYSTADLSFYQSNIISKEVIANDDPSAYQLSFFNRLSIAFENGWVILKEVVITIVNLWACIIAGLLLWFLIHAYRKRKIHLQQI